MHPHFTTQPLSTSALAKEAPARSCSCKTKECFYSASKHIFPARPAQCYPLCSALLICKIHLARRRLGVISFRFFSSRYDTFSFLFFYYFFVLFVCVFMLSNCGNRGYIQPTWDIIMKEIINRIEGAADITKLSYKIFYRKNKTIYT